MDPNREHRRLARDLVEEVLKTALAVEEIMGALLEDIPEGALPGGDNANALLEMMIGTVVPAGGVMEVPVPGPPAPGALAVEMPAVQSTTVEPGTASEALRNPTACAIGFPLVFASPWYTRTTTRFMLAMLVSK